MLYLGLPIKNGWIFPWQTVRHFQTKQLGSAGFVLNGIKLPQGDGLGWFLQAISDKKMEMPHGMLGLPHNSSF
jgi:hypothetical protein